MSKIKHHRHKKKTSHSSGFSSRRHDKQRIAELEHKVGKLQGKINGKSEPEGGGFIAFIILAVLCAIVIFFFAKPPEYPAVEETTDTQNTVSEMNYSERVAIYEKFAEQLRPGTNAEEVWDFTFKKHISRPSEGTEWKLMPGIYDIRKSQRIENSYVIIKWNTDPYITKSDEYNKDYVAPNPDAFITETTLYIDGKTHVS